LTTRLLFELFIGIGRGELLPYGSYYIAGFLHERPLARLREDLVKLRIERVEDQHESEDHAAILCEIMSGIAGGQFPAPAGADRQLFEKHLAPWIGRFFADLAPRRLAVTHLEELGRDEDDLWTLQHYALAHARLQEMAPDMRVCPARMGYRIVLN
jgi:hypothetical protein